jgi:ABC-type Co2+ transport system permease subunit
MKLLVQAAMVGDAAATAAAAATWLMGVVKRCVFCAGRGGICLLEHQANTGITNKH